VPVKQSLKIALKATRQLGFEQVRWYAYYQFGLRTGLFRRMTPAKEPTNDQQTVSHVISTDLISIPKPDQLATLIGDEASALLAESNEIGKGKVRLFGGPLQELNLLVSLPLEHWTLLALDQRKAGVEDIKFIWEPARFTWVYSLVRAYQLSEDENYADIFWREFEAFADINIPNLGPNWVSSQEVAFRLIAFTFAYQVFYKLDVSTPDRIDRLSTAIADHATRIPPTLSYARAQNNNHLLTEAAGLLTAGHAIPEHPQSEKWRAIGWRWFNHALQNQITDEGTYVQQSTNYHRLMLQVALWVKALGGSLPEQSLQRLAAGTKWLSGLVDPETGRVPNLGHNDGAYFQPLSACSYHDYRPVVQAAALAFLGERKFPSGPWDELALWLGFLDQASMNSDELIEPPAPLQVSTITGSHLVLRNHSNQSWANFRVTNFRSRPAHADQLHLDLWWRGHNVAQDAGTYLYNPPPPWDNSFAQTQIHNTVTIDERDQMTRTGRFLWLDWAQAHVVHQHTPEDGSSIELVAQHDGYSHLGVIHRRAVTSDQSGIWLIKDSLLPEVTKRSHQGEKKEAHGTVIRTYRARLHWLLPDWSWEFEENEDIYHTSLRLRSPHGWLNLLVGIEPATSEDNAQHHPSIELVRAGEHLLGSGPISPTTGWVSPTYGYKIPALSFAIVVESPLPIVFRSQWNFPQDS
jgi:hypothetical protein